MAIHECALHGCLSNIGFEICLALNLNVCMFYLGPFSINGVQYTQCDMILNMWTKARTWKSYDCYWARYLAQDDL